MAAQHLGRLLFTFGRLEMNVALFLAGLHPDRDFDQEIVAAEKRTFGDKLDALQVQLMDELAADAEAEQAWAAWFEQARTLRALRNRFAHGRWACLPVQHQIVHVVGLPGSPNQASTFYTLEALELEVRKAEQIAADFQRLRRTERP